jgi:hypothetical protein
MPRKGLSLVAAALVALLAALLAATPCKSEEDAVGGETLGPLSPAVVSLVSQQAIVPVSVGTAVITCSTILRCSTRSARLPIFAQSRCSTQTMERRCLRSVPPTSSRASICTRSTAKPPRPHPSRHNKAACSFSTSASTAKTAFPASSPTGSKFPALTRSTGSRSGSTMAAGRSKFPSAPSGACAAARRRRLACL